MLRKSQTVAYSLGAVGKDMVYALSSGYVMYYYQDILHLSAAYVGLVLMLARIFDAANDPFMGILVAKTKSKHGQFVPWLLSGTVLNAFVLFALFSAPSFSKAGLMGYFAIIYVLWGVSYTMMDIPFWSMIPHVTHTLEQREKVSVLLRSFAGIGSAIITVFTVKLVAILGKGNEKAGFAMVAALIAVFFVITEGMLCYALRHDKADDMTTSVSIKDMFKALWQNDQAMVTVIVIVCVNFALYITSNFLIYFFKYDVAGSAWENTYTVFTSVGGLGQLLAMMLVYPLWHKYQENTHIFKNSLLLAIAGYIVLLILCYTPYVHMIALLALIGLMVFIANGIMTVLTTVFLSASVDYGQLKTGKRMESVIFSMQTFVVKAASGFSVFLCGLALNLTGLEKAVTPMSLTGLRLWMTLVPIARLCLAYIVFKKYFKLTDEMSANLAKEVNKIS